MLALLVACAVPVWLASYASEQRALAVPLARPGARRGRRLVCRGHALCRTPLRQGAARVRHGGVRRRNHRCGHQYAHRSGADGAIWLAIRPQILRRGAANHRANFLASFLSRRFGAGQERGLTWVKGYRPALRLRTPRWQRHHELLSRTSHLSRPAAGVVCR